MIFQGYLPKVKGKKIWLPILILLIGILGFSYYRSHKMTIRRRPVSSHVPKVDIMTPVARDHDVSIHAMGTVLAQRKVILSSRVSGQIVSASADFVRGKVVKKGETLLTIDDTDYVLARQKAINSLNQAKAELAMERGKQEIAKEELRLAAAGAELSLENKDLVLRKPQLQKAQALVQKAETDLKKANVDLARTRIKAPFDALILETKSGLGALVSVQSPLADLVDITSYQVEALVPFDQMENIFLDPAHGSTVSITSFHGKGQWQGKVVGTTGMVTDKTRMAGVLIQVDDPLGIKTSGKDHASEKKQTSTFFAPLLLGDYVRVEILGKTLKQVYAVPRAAVRANQTLWKMKNNTLQIVSITPVWEEEDLVFFSQGISSRDKVIISDLPVPIPGMVIENRQ